MYAGLIRGCLVTKSYRDVVPDFAASIITKSGSFRSGDVTTLNFFCLETVHPIGLERTWMPTQPLPNIQRLRPPTSIS